VPHIIARDQGSRGTTFMERGKPSTYIALPTVTGLRLLGVTRSDLLNIFNNKDHLTAYICESFRYDRSSAIRFPALKASVLKRTVLRVIAEDTLTKLHEKLGRVY